MNAEEKRELKAELKRELTEELAQDRPIHAGESHPAPPDEAEEAEQTVSTVSERFGLTRRQALEVLGLLAVGYALSDAVAYVTAGSSSLTAPSPVGADEGKDAELSIVSLQAGDGRFGSIETETLLTVPQMRARAESGSGTKADPFVVQSGLLEEYAGLLNFGKGWFEVDGLETDESRGYDEQSVYLQGDGARTTTLQHAADAPSTPTVRFAGSGGGNFGGIRDMTVYGAGEGDESGTANIVESDGNVIDLQFENVMIRHGGNHGLYLAPSSSGTRVTNCWIENVGDTCLYIGGGSRIKVDNLHAIDGRGIYQNGMRGQFSNLTLSRVDGNDGIRVSGSRNFFDTVSIYKDANRGIYNSAGELFLQNVWVYHCRQSAVISGGPVFADSLVAGNWGSDSGHLVRLLTDNSSISNVWGAASESGFSTSLALIYGDNNYVGGIGGVAEIDWELTVAGGSKNVLDNVVNVPYTNIADRGYCTLVNRWGTNEGAPPSRGEWNGESSYAGRMGAIVWDTTASPWTAYCSPPNGNRWISLSS